MKSFHGNAFIAFVAYVTLFSCTSKDPSTEILKASHSNRVSIDFIVREGVEKCKRDTKNIDLTGVNSWPPHGFLDSEIKLSEQFGVHIQFVKFYHDGKDFTGMMAWYSHSDFIYRGSGDSLGKEIKVLGEWYRLRANDHGFFIYERRLK